MKCEIYAKVTKKLQSIILFKKKKNTFWLMRGLLGHRVLYPSVVVHRTQPVKHTSETTCVIAEMVYTMKNLDNCIFH